MYFPFSQSNGERSESGDATSIKRVKCEVSDDAGVDGQLTPNHSPGHSPGQTHQWDAVTLRQLVSLQHWSHNSSILNAVKENKLIPPPAIMREGYVY